MQIGTDCKPEYNMKVIICFLLSFLAVYAAPANDGDGTNEKLEKLFTNVFLISGKNRYENRTVREPDERVLNLKKDNVDVTLSIKERKFFTRKVLMNVTSEMKGNTFFVNATSIYLDAQENGIVQVNGTVDQKPLNETGRISINWKRLKETGIMEKGKFNQIYVTVLNKVPENEWSKPTIKVSGLEELVKHVTDEDIAEALNSQMKKKRQMQEDKFDELDSDSIPRLASEKSYNKHLFIGSFPTFDLNV